jgi:hypothetical protein
LSNRHKSNLDFALQEQSFSQRLPCTFGILRDKCYCELRRFSPQVTEIRLLRGIQEVLL